MKELLDIIGFANVGDKPCYLIIVALIALGYFLKHAVRDGGDNSSIPRILFAVSVLVTPLLVGNAAGYSVAGVVSGLLLGVIYWAIAWAAHGVVIKRLENYFAKNDNNNGCPQTPLMVALMVALTLGGCASLAPTAEKNLDYVRPAVRIAASLALDAAADVQDLQAKRDLIGGLSAFVGTLATGDALTAKQIEAALGEWLPAKTHWDTLAAAIGGVADMVRPYLGKDAALWVKFWGQVSYGLADAFNQGK